MALLSPVRPCAALESDYGAVVRRLTSLCHQIDALSTPLPPPTTISPTHTSTQQSKAKGETRAMVQLPRLVLVGGQSTGKSSLVECLAGVALPRSTGTCTRGPLDIDITSSDGTPTSPRTDLLDQPWSAVVSLVISPSQSANEVSIRSKGGIFQFGDAISDPASVADRIRRATLAVRDLDNLNLPASPPFAIADSPYLRMTPDEVEEAEGRRSTLPMFFPPGARLSLSVRAPGAEPLRFTDLPGLIALGRQSDIKAIRDMILRDISGSNVIIVLTASLGMDIAHQSAFDLVKTVDPSGDRTVGVFTMPDRMAAGGQREWADVINESSPLNGDRSGERYLKHGWHVVRCPSQDEDRNSIGEIEQRFFFPNEPDPAAPWYKTATMLDGVGPRGDQDFVETRCGLGSLYHHLSQLLLRQIGSALPAILSSCQLLQQDLAEQIKEAAASASGGSTTASKGNGLRYANAAQPLLKDRRLASQSQPRETNDIAIASDGFDVDNELKSLLADIIKQLRYTEADINRALLPHLLQELSAAAPVYLPFTAQEFKDRHIVSTYQPRAWSFKEHLSSTVAAKNADGSRSDGGADGGDDASNAAASLPRKKAVLLGDLGALLASDTDARRLEASGIRLRRLHATFQSKLQSVVLAYAEFCKACLQALIHKPIPRTIQARYPQLCTDILAVIDNLLESELDNEMLKLADAVADDTLIDDRLSVEQVEAEAEGLEVEPQQKSEYVRWVEEDMDTFLTLRMSLLAKRKTEAGDKTFIGDLSKCIELSRRHNLTPPCGKFDAIVFKYVGLGRSTNTVKTRESSPTKGAKGAAAAAAKEAAVEAAPAARKRGRPSAADAAVKSSATASRSSTPEVEHGDIRNATSASDCKLATPVRASPSHPPMPLAIDMKELKPNAKMDIFPNLVVHAPYLHWTQPNVVLVLRLMAELRADYNCLSVMVAKDAQLIPVKLMRDVHTFLRTSLETTLRTGLTEKEVYERYFFQADRPRRERLEWIANLKQRRDEMEAAIKELAEMAQQMTLSAGHSGGVKRDNWRFEVGNTPAAKAGGDAPKKAAPSTPPQSLSRSKVGSPQTVQGRQTIASKLFASHREHSPTPTPSSSRKLKRCATVSSQVTPKKRVSPPDSTTSTPSAKRHTSGGLRPAAPATSETYVDDDDDGGDHVHHPGAYQGHDAHIDPALRDRVGQDSMPTQQKAQQPHDDDDDDDDDDEGQSWDGMTLSSAYHTGSQGRPIMLFSSDTEGPN